MYIINANFTINKTIGDLSESRIGQLKEALGAKYPEFLKPNKETLLFKKGVSALVISPAQIICVNQGDVTDFNIEEITTSLAQVNEILGLSSKANFSMRFEATEATKENVFEKSKTHLEEVSTGLSPYGIGYRFMIDNDTFFGDIHIEPYIQDNQKVFFNVILESKDQMDIAESENLFNQMFLFGTENARSTARNLFSL